MHVPSILMVTIFVVWGVDLVIRAGANWAMLVWLFLASFMWAFLAALFVIPAVIAVQYISERLRISAVASVLGQAVVVAGLGALFAVTSGAMSLVAGVLLGAIAAVSIALLPVPDPTQRVGRAS